MQNPAIDMLQSIISAAVNTQYKDVPPSEKQFMELAETLRNNMSASFSVTDEEFTAVLFRLRASLVIQMEVGVFILDKNTPHKSWLLSRKADFDLFFWNRYKRYLEEIKHWNPRVTATLDKVSDEVVDLLGDPQSETPFQRRGLVLGDVQSGKTANYTAFCNKAADAGYRIIIIMAGMMENLRQQTQSRLDMEFSGRKSDYFLDPNAGNEIKNQPVGVGKYGQQKRMASFTSVIKDFDINVLKSNGLNLQSVSDPVVLIVKKNKKILSNLIKWLSKSKDLSTGKIMLPMLLIDDEADNASVNTKKRRILLQPSIPVSANYYTILVRHPIWELQRLPLPTFLLTLRRKMKCWEMIFSRVILYIPCLRRQITLVPMRFLEMNHHFFMPYR